MTSAWRLIGDCRVSKSSREALSEKASAYVASSMDSEGVQAAISEYYFLGNHDESTVTAIDRLFDLDYIPDVILPTSLLEEVLVSEGANVMRVLTHQFEARRNTGNPMSEEEERWLLRIVRNKDSMITVYNNGYS